jgi:hypothetical protein
LDWSLTSHGEGVPVALEHPLAFHYSKVSRHYGLPMDKPSKWVANSVVTLRVRFLSPDDLSYSHQVLSGSPALFYSCCTPGSRVEGGRSFSLQAVESRYNREQWYFDYSCAQPFDRNLGDTCFTVGGHSSSRRKLKSSAFIRRVPLTLYLICCAGNESRRAH